MRECPPRKSARNTTSAVRGCIRLKPNISAFRRRKKMASKLPYETATSGDKALIELQRTLAKFGCQSFGTMTDAERGVTIVQFKWRNRQVSLRASWKGYAN